MVHDQLADRWIITQGVFDAAAPHQCIAISTTGDPSGSYFLYDFVLPGNGSRHLSAIRPVARRLLHGHLQFNQAGTAYLGQGAFAFDRLRCSMETRRQLHPLRPRRRRTTACCRRTWMA